MSGADRKAYTGTGIASIKFRVCVSHGSKPGARADLQQSNNEFMVATPRHSTYILLISVPQNKVTIRLVGYEVAKARHQPRVARVIGYCATLQAKISVDGDDESIYESVWELMRQYV